MSSPSTPPPYLLLDDTNDGFSGYTVLTIITWVVFILAFMAWYPLSSYHHCCHQPFSPITHDIDIKLDKVPSHTNPEPVRDQPFLCSMSTIELPPAAYLKPSDTSPDLDNSLPPPWHRTGQPWRKYWSIICGPKQYFFVRLLGGAIASWGTWAEVRVRHWGLFS